MGIFVDGLGGLLGAAGVLILFLGSINTADARRERLLKIGGAALATGGLVLMAGSMIGWVANDELFGGLLMTVVGSGIGAAKPGAGRGPDGASTPPH